MASSIDFTMFSSVFIVKQFSRKAIETIKKTPWAAWKNIHLSGINPFYTIVQPIDLENNIKYSTFMVLSENSRIIGGLWLQPPYGRSIFTVAPSDTTADRQKSPSASYSGLLRSTMPPPPPDGYPFSL